MQQGRYTTQGGSIAVFAIVAVVLSIALIGAVFVAQKRGYQVRSDQPIMEVADDAANQPAEQPQPSEQQSDAEKQAAEQKAAQEKAAAEAEQKRVEAEKQAAAEAERQRQAQTPAQQQQAAAAPAEVPHTGAAPQALPTTGPADNLMQLIAGGIMVALVAAYLKSYRYRFGSLLK